MSTREKETEMILNQELSTELTECEVYIAELERVLTTLAGGRLPPALVPATLLRYLQL